MRVYSSNEYQTGQLNTLWELLVAPKCQDVTRRGANGWPVKSSKRYPRVSEAQLLENKDRVETLIIVKGGHTHPNIWGKRLPAAAWSGGNERFG